MIAKAPVKNGKGITLNGNANVINGNATTTQVANNDTNSDRIKYVYVREHEHMHHGHSHAHSHIHSAPDSISSVAYMVRNIYIETVTKETTQEPKRLLMKNPQFLKFWP